MDTHRFPLLILSSFKYADLSTITKEITDTVPTQTRELRAEIQLELKSPESKLVSSSSKGTLHLEPSTTLTTKIETMEQSIQTSTSTQLYLIT